MRARCVLRTILLLSVSWGLLGSAHAALTELSGAIDLKAGAQACVLTNAGGVKCWGTAYLGDGRSGGRPTAGDVIGLTTGVTAIGVGKGGQKCAALAAGGLKCWGPNNAGQVGDGTTIERTLPIDVVGLSGLVVGIAGGDLHTCALMSGGGVKCWGANDVGQLGIGTTGSGSATPVDVVGLAGNAVAIAAGPKHTCVIISGNGAQCWGANASGQLGDGSTANRSSPAAVSGLPTNLTAIAAGGSDTSSQSAAGGHTCAITAAGGTKCWGANGSGQLGDGSTTNHLTAFDVVGSTSGTAKVATGGRLASNGFSSFNSPHTCAVTIAGAAKCWGSNACSQIGDGGELRPCFAVGGATGYLTPFDVVTLNGGVADIGAGAGFSCALLTDSRAKCWGSFGAAVGNGGQGSSSPVAVMTGTLPQVISVQLQGPIAIGATSFVSGYASADSGIPIVFTSTTPSICSTSASTFRVASNPIEWDADVTGIASGICRIVASQAGNAYYDPAVSVEAHVRIGDAVQQTIAFGPPPNVPVNGVGTVNATASSGLILVLFHTNTPSICSVSGNVVTGLAVGDCTIAATQAGDELYAPVESAQIFPITANSGTHGLVVNVLGTGTGTVTSSPAGIACGVTCAGNFASSVTLTASADAGFVFGGWSGACSGGGTCTLPMTSDATVGALFVIDSPIPRLANLSTRGLTSPNDPLIGGFIIGGSTAKTVVVSVAGPSLNAFGIPNAVSDPNFELYRGSDGALIATNNDWQTQNAADVYALQKSGLAPTHPKEAALRMALAPGAYTAVARGGPGENGIALIGIFEADHPEVPLMNVSTRGVVATGNNVMIAGFIVNGSNPQTLVVNVAGPSLAQYGVSNPLANPRLTIVRGSDNTIIATNDDWQAQTNPADVAAIQATGFQPNDPAEPAVKLTLPPGAYTAIVEGAGSSVGTALVGVFAVP